MKTRTHTPSSERARGLALIELIVVLLILVLIAGTAITATQGMVEGTFYDTTHTTLERIDEAILGPYAPPTTHDDTLIEGFVADVGRLPRVVGTDPELALAELWAMPDGIASFEIQRPLADPCLRIPGGWRGPYLHIGFGTTRLLDGWGRALVVLKDNDTAAHDGELLGRVASLGADPNDGVADDDPAIVIASTIAPVVLPRHLATLSVRIEPLLEGESTANVLVRLYVPDAVDGRVRALFQVRLGGNGAQPLEDEALLSGEFMGVPVGQRIVRAYDWPYDQASPSPDTPLHLRSAPVAVRLTRLGTSEVVLKIFSEPIPPCESEL